MTVKEPRRIHYRLTLAVLTLGAISYSMQQALILPALPTIQRDLHVSESTVTWIVTSYLLSASVATPIAGRLGDMYGKGRVLVIVLAILAVGTFMSAIASSIGLLLLGRALGGIGGGLFPLGFGIIRDEFPPREVAGGIGLMSSVIGIGSGAGVILAGLILLHLSYHWLFWIPLILTLIAVASTHLFVPESPIRSPGRVDWRAAALMSAGITAVLVAVSESTVWGWTSPKTVVLIAIGLILLAGWVVVELHSREPLVDMRMMRIRGVWTTNVVALMVGVGMYSSYILVPQFVEQPKSTGYGLGASVLASGIFLLPSTIMLLLAGQFTGVFDRLVGSKSVLMAGNALCAAAFVVLATTPSEHLVIYLASAIMGFGVGLSFAALANVIVKNVPRSQTGVATGMNTVMRTLGGAIGGQIVATLLASNVGVEMLPTQRAFALAFGVCAAAQIVGFAVCLLIPSEGTRSVRMSGRRHELSADAA
jgi:EmrB/QacA subfamily drug resistance transporter